MPPAFEGVSLGLGSGMDRQVGLSLQYPQREPHESEKSFFLGNPNVAGYAAPDSSVVLNPQFGGDKKSVLANERFRQLFKDVPDLFPSDMNIAEHQRQAAKNLGQYGENEEALRQTILARMLSGDTSLAPYTLQQYKAVESILDYLSSQQR